MAADDTAEAARDAVARVRAALLSAGHADTVTAFPDGTRTAAEAAATLGCDVARIAKSMIFRVKGTPTPEVVLVITSSSNRVDATRVAAVLGRPVKRADPDWVHQVTGFPVGGVAPIGFLVPPVTLMDEDLVGLDPVWAGAGSASHMFRSSAEALRRMTGARVAVVKLDG